MKRPLLLLLTLLLTLTSCEQMRSTWHRHDRIARIKGEVLYESDVKALLPPGSSPEDSAAFVSQYVNTWALSRLLLIKAKDELPKSEKDVAQQVEEFRNNLLGYRYEKYFIESRLDTTVSQAQMEEYYEAHSQSYVLSQPIFKGRAITLLTKSPYYDAIKTSFRASEPTDIRALEELCYASAEKYTDFENQWVPLSALAKEINMDYEQCVTRFASGNSQEIEESGTTYFVFIEDMRAAGELSPFEYNRNHIRETIISKRKQDLLNTLERDLLEDARLTNTLKLYDKK